MKANQHIFISYKRENSNYALQVCEILRKWGYKYWIDIEHGSPGGSFIKEINHAIETCKTCLGIMTPLATASDFVINEWLLAVTKGKDFVPLLFEATDLLYPFNGINYIDFTTANRVGAFSKLKVHLDKAYTSKKAIKASTDPHTDYLRELNETVDNYLEAKLFRNDLSLIELAATPDESAVNSEARRKAIHPLFRIGGVVDKPIETFEQLALAFNYYKGRVLLLGEPGAGKTISLLQFAKEAIAKRYLDQSAPLPILGIIPDWKPNSSINVVDWLSQMENTPSDAKLLIESGKALLLLDGLDELGKERSESPPNGQKYDPRLRFIQQIPPNNQIFLTCRVQDYEEISEKVRLNGAITLQPLSDTQIQIYLKNQPELLQFVLSDLEIKKWLHTPLLLSIFAVAYRNLNDKDRVELKQIKTQNDFRDKVFNDYVYQRYKHEIRKYDESGLEVPFTLEEVKTALGAAASEALGG